MRVLAVEYEEDSGPGVFVEAVEGEGAALETWRRWSGEGMPGEVDDYGAVICLGGSMHPVGADAGERPELTEDRALMAEVLARGTPLLGVCLGAELATQAAGGAVEKLEGIEVGWAEVELTPEGLDDPLIGPMGERFEGFEWHSYACVPPEGSVVLARSAASPQAWRLGEQAWAIQFHAEVTAEDATTWLSHWQDDEDAVASGLDPAEIVAETERKIEAWNALGRELAARFVRLAAERPTPA